MLKNWDRREQTRFIWLQKETGGWFFERNNEAVGSIQCGEFLEQLRNWQPLNNDSAPRSYLVRRMPFENK